VYVRLRFTMKFSNIIGGRPSPYESCLCLEQRWFTGLRYNHQGFVGERYHSATVQFRHFSSWWFRYRIARAQCTTPIPFETQFVSEHAPYCCYRTLIYISFFSQYLPLVLDLIMICFRFCNMTQPCTNLTVKFVFYTTRKEPFRSQSLIHSFVAASYCILIIASSTE
jgi:hypothetical protein